MDGVAAPHGVSGTLRGVPTANLVDQRFGRARGADGSLSAWRAAAALRRAPPCSLPIDATAAPRMTHSPLLAADSSVAPSAG
jgi:hypothetical protein